MRSGVLTLALCGTLAALLWTERRLAATAAGERELAVRLFSRGSTFPHAWSEQGLHGELSIGDCDLNGPPRTSGLRVATISRERELIGFRNFELESSPADVRALAEVGRAAPLETVLALCVQGAIVPNGADQDARRADLAQLLTELGAEAAPLDAPSASWCLLTVRRPVGWVRLAESRSDDAPTRLSFLLRPAGFAYERRASQLRVDSP